MTRTNPLISVMLPMIGLMMIVGLFGLIMLGSGLSTTNTTIHQTSNVTIDWLHPDQIQVPNGLTIAEHAAKHNGETEKIYEMLLEGKCAEVAKFCGGSEIEKLYTCVDPVTGIVGAVLQFGDRITTGYFETRSGYWTKRVERENWGYVNDEFRRYDQ